VYNEERFWKHEADVADFLPLYLSLTSNGDLLRITLKWKTCDMKLISNTGIAFKTGKLTEELKFN
jgi:hypothetical protein